MARSHVGMSVVRVGWFEVRVLEPVCFNDIKVKNRFVFVDILFE